MLINSIIKLISLICDIIILASVYIGLRFKSNNYIGIQFIEPKNISKNLYESIIKHQDLLQPNKAIFLLNYILYIYILVVYFFTY